nr:hypothetical protein [Tanacetum cinerariifolium]
MTNSQESDARKLPLSPKYVVKSHSDEEEPTKEQTEDSIHSPCGIHNVSDKEEPTEDKPMEDEPKENESKEKEPKEDASEEPPENKIYGLVNQNGDEEELAWRAVSDDNEPFREEVPKVNEYSHTIENRGTKRKRESVEMINEAFEAKVEILNEYGDKLEELNITKDTLHKATRPWTVIVDTGKGMIEEMVFVANRAKSVAYYVIDRAKQRPEPSKKLCECKTQEQEDEEKSDEEKKDDQEK